MEWHGRKPIVDERAIDMWYKDHWSLRMIGKYFSVSGTAVHKYLRKHGVDTSKAATRVNCICMTCSKPFQMCRAYFRERLLVYCSPECYYQSIRNPGYISSRQGMRVARETVRSLWRGFRMQYLVHHIDGNESNNDPCNLMVFANNSDHMRWHRAGGIESGVVPLWSGNSAIRVP